MSRIIRTITATEKEIIFQQANEAYAEIQKDPKLLQEYQQELALWESTLADGLEDQ